LRNAFGAAIFFGLAVVIILGAVPAWAGGIDGLVASGRDSVANDLSLGPASILGDEPNYLEIGVGVFDALEEGRGSASGAFLGELRYGRKLFYIGPAIGLMANNDGGVFGYGGFYADARLGHFVVTPLLGLGGYKRGGSKDLGGIFQFRVSLGIAYEMESGMRLGFRAAHISNASIHDHNPGEEEFLLTFALPF